MIQDAQTRESMWSHDRRVCLVIRYDDYGGAYSPACAARFEVEHMLQNEMTSRGWPWVCSITPRQSLDPENVDEQRVVSLWEDQPRVALLRRAVPDGLCEPAVHGLTHHTWKQLPEWGTEFAGLPTDKQLEILKTAKHEVELLAGRPVSVFVPPWNSYDERTLQAADEAGLRVLSAGLEPLLLARGRLRMVPCTIDFRTLQEVLDRKRRLPGGSVVVLLFHAFDFVSVDARIGCLQLAEFGPLLDRAVAQLEMKVVPIARIPELVGPELENRVRRASEFQKRYFSLPYALPFLGRQMQRWMLPHRLALVPVRSAALVDGLVTAIKCLWLPGIAVLACTPAYVVSRFVGSEPACTIGLFAFAVAGVLATARSGRNAFLKRYRGRWGMRTIGLRTWTGITAGAVLALSAFLQWLIRFITP